MFGRALPCVCEPGLGRMFSWVRDRLPAGMARLLRDTTGATAMFVAIGLIPLIGSVGLAVDSSLGYLLKSRMSKSLDTAGLAAGRVALNDDAEEVARKYFDSNFGESANITLTDFSFELDDTRQFVTLTAEATTPTVFMRIFGQDTVTVAARTVIQRRTTGMELALVMDNTGSMWGSAFTAMQQAAYDLVDIIYGDDTEIDNLWISLVPYTATVNIGNTRTAWLDSLDRVIVTPSVFFDGGLEGLRRGAAGAVRQWRCAAVGPLLQIVLLCRHHANPGQQLAAAQEPLSATGTTGVARTSDAGPRSRR